MLQKLQDYTAGDAYPFHMPGHKRQLENADFPFSIDITEIDGFDNLHHPEGCIKEIEEKAAKLYRAERAFLLVNGATGGILSAVKAMTHRGDKVIVARNCHTSVHHAVGLLGLVPEYYLPDPPKGERTYRCFGGVNPGKLDRLLKEHPDAKLFVMTSPTYEGICSDIRSIAAVCHQHGVLLLVDEAHGAHFPFHDSFPESAVSCGADCAVVSLHKTMPALTQTALLMIKDSIPEQNMQTELAVFQTSSPSYVLMSSIEYALDYAQLHPDAFEAYLGRIRKLEEKLAKLKKLSLLFHDKGEVLQNVFAYDCGKLVVTAYGTELSGGELARRLREEHQIETEMSSAHYVIAMTSVCDTDEGFDRLLHALLQIDKTIGYSANASTSAVLAQLPQKAFEPFESQRRRAVTVLFADAAGKTAMETIYAYPPGIPYIVPGEVISQSILEQLAQLLSNGVEVTSATKQLPQAILVADW
ncbi:MAG: aminotransferase class I/II-fold pyridoxal phosphate-dependent enzyme [Ruminococcus sp.]|nr:aminotransferase class I/II-fold pyridoxal phosphate-dependent enzyme [Ruminococcus sp.]